MRQFKTFCTLLVASFLAALGWLLGSPQAVYAGIYNADSPVTYKEYWAPHSAFKGGRDETKTGCVDTQPNGFSWYVEPAGNCLKSITITLPDDFFQALKVELYLDLWRSRVNYSARYQVNNGVWRTAMAGHEWSRSPYVVEIPKSELVQGVNTLTFQETTGLFHLHDAAIRIYFDETHPLYSGGQPITAPDGQLLSVWADNGSIPAANGGTLQVNDDQLVLTARVTTPASFVEFHGFYRGYDLDVNDSDGDLGVLDTEWHNRARNNYQSGGLSSLPTGGTIDHIGTVATPTQGEYSVWWPIPTIINQSNVRFKIRIVDANGVVREVVRVSAPFTLARNGNFFIGYRPSFQDTILYSGGTKPLSVTRLVNLPTSLNLAAYQQAYFIGAHWENPLIAINGNTAFRAFNTNEDVWALSVRSINLAWLRTGTNNVVYTHASGFGEFIEKPGPLLLLKQTTQSPDNAPPAIIGNQPAPNATEVPSTSALVLSIADGGRGVNFAALQLWVNGTAVTPQRTGTPDEYTLTYMPDHGWQPGATVNVHMAACDFAGNCGAPTNYSFTVAPVAYTLTVNPVVGGSVDISPQKPTYTSGDIVMIAATPNANWAFSDWSAQVNHWWDARWAYRLPITVQANGYERTNRPAETVINFTPLLNGLGQSGAFDPNSLRVVEVNNADLVIDDQVPLQFDPAASYNPTVNASGTLIFLLKGATPATGERRYYLYFDVAGKGFAPATVGDQVVLTAGIDEGQMGYRLQTANATYAYHLQGGGFASLMDVDGNDWLDYHAAPADAGGAFRGTPNLVPPPDGLFHPGNLKSITTLVASGPLKETFRSQTTDGKWEVQWEVYPTYATMTVIKRPSNKNYWWLYEGTPGGKIEDSGATAVRDFVTLAGGSSFTVDQTYSADLPSEEWLYLSDPDVDNAATAARSIFLIHPGDDSSIDSYRTMSSGGTKKMAIWGFGRNLTTNETFLTSTPNRFTIGLMDTTAYASAAQIINGLYRDLALVVGNPEANQPVTVSGADNPFTLTITGDTVITVNFAVTGGDLALATNIVGNGTVSRTPDRSGYLPNESVQLTANPAPGWSFSGWSGDLTTPDNPAVIIMNSEKTVTATFAPLAYTLSASVVGDGSVTVTPLQSTYTYNDIVTLNAVAGNGWVFSGWSGHLTGAANPASLTVSGDMAVTATFQPQLYTLSIAANGNGTIAANPAKPKYNYGEAVTLSATPASGWQFSGWSGALSGTANPAMLVIDGNRTVVANFTPAQATTSITIILDSQPDHQRNVSFAGDLGSFKLDDITPSDGDAMISSRSVAVQPGTYRVNQVTSASGWLVGNIECNPASSGALDLAASRVTITILQGENITCTFLFQQLSSVRANVFDDRNGNGLRTTGEPWLSGWGVTLYDEQGNNLGNLVTNQYGKANFNLLPPKPYTVCTTLPNGWRPTQPSLDSNYGQPCALLLLGAGQIGEVFFGNTNAPVASAAEGEAALVNARGVMIYPAEDDGAIEDSEAVFVDRDIDTPQAEAVIFLPLVQQEAEQPDGE